jgi:hypothetical protein
MAEPSIAINLNARDEQLLDQLFVVLQKRVTGEPSSLDGSFVAELANLSPGLRAMATTHHLDVSLTLDDLAWHFLNFGEPGFVAATGAGLRELDLVELADLFDAMYSIVAPHISSMREEAGYEDVLTREGEIERVNVRVDSADALMENTEPKVSGSAIYGAWVRYARMHPFRL